MRLKAWSARWGKSRGAERRKSSSVPSMLASEWCSGCAHVRLLAHVERGNAAGGYAPALGCGSPSLARGPLRCSIAWPAEKLASLTAVVPLDNLDESDSTRALAHAATRPALLGAAYVAAGAHPPTALPARTVTCVVEHHERRCAVAVPGGGDLWGGEQRSS